MRYIPHTRQDIADMLDRIGAVSVSELFEHIPSQIRERAALNLPQPLCEQELIETIGSMAEADTGAYASCFAGGGSYRHHIPPIIDQLLLRSEFYTAYTPYQPEISQGTLQSIFEFQTMVARLLEMEVANASVYDGASALAEAVMMAARTSRKRKFLVSAGLNEQYLQVVRTYTAHLDYEFVELQLDATGRTDLSILAELINDQVAGVILQSPNALGVIEDLRNAGKIIAPSTPKYIVAFTEPLAFGMLAGPGRFGADIVCGEGQSFGIPVSFGGPYLGLFAARMADVRNMPGRICGQTVDAQGQTGYVLTLSTREQHIRREKATSNICTNQALCALAACMYMSLMGAKGLPKLAKINHANAMYIKKHLAQAGATLPFDAPIFNEFVFETKASAAKLLDAMAQQGILGGSALPERFQSENAILCCTTELISKMEMDEYVQIVKKFL